METQNKGQEKIGETMNTKTFDQRYRAKYLCFSLDEPLEQAKKTFVKKYKQEPEEAFHDMRLLWLGPVPDPRQATQLDSSNISGPGAAFDQLKML